MRRNSKEINEQMNESKVVDETPTAECQIDEETRSLIDEFFGTNGEENSVVGNELEEENTLPCKGTGRARRLRQQRLHQQKRREGKLLRAKAAVQFLETRTTGLSEECRNLLKRSGELELSRGDFRSLTLEQQRGLSALASDFIFRAEGLQKKVKPRKAKAA